MILVACDPGLDGALCYYDTKSGYMQIDDMPTTVKDRSAKKAMRIIDEPALWELLQFYRLNGATHFVPEEVGGLPGQGAPRAFNFGYGAGLLHAFARAAGFAIEPIAPVRWKAAMRVSTTPAAIRDRASQVIPTHAHLWALGKLKPSSEVNLGRAEAALLACYGERILGGKK